MHTPTRQLSLVPESSPVLHHIALPVTLFDEQLHQTVDNMKDVMRKEGGIGLAAPQVGVPQRIIILLDLDTQQPQAWINPVIVQAQGWMWHDEGCLSLPGKRVRKMRSQWVKVSACDENGVRHEFERSNLEAACVQHEIDHLNGVLMTD